MQSPMMKHIMGLHKQRKGTTRLKDAKAQEPQIPVTTVGHTPVGEQKNAGPRPIHPGHSQTFQYD